MNSAVCLHLQKLIQLFVYIFENCDSYLFTFSNWIFVLNLNFDSCNFWRESLNIWQIKYYFFGWDIFSYFWTLCTIKEEKTIKVFSPAYPFLWKNFFHNIVTTEEKLQCLKIPQKVSFLLSIQKFSRFYRHPKCCFLAPNILKCWTMVTKM